MGTINNIAQETNQSFGSNGFKTTITDEAVEFDSLKDKFVFKDYVEFEGGGSGAQEQADWNETDDSKVDYIKNKPFYNEDNNLVTENSIEVKYNDTNYARLVKAQSTSRLEVVNDGLATSYEKSHIIREISENVSKSISLPTEEGTLALISDIPTYSPELDYKGIDSTNPTIALAANTFTYCNGNPTTIRIGDSDGLDPNKLNKVEGIFTTSTNASVSITIGQTSTAITWISGSIYPTALTADSKYLFRVFGNSTIGFYGEIKKL